MCRFLVETYRQGESSQTRFEIKSQNKYTQDRDFCDYLFSFGFHILRGVGKRTNERKNRFRRVKEKVRMNERMKEKVVSDNTMCIYAVELMPYSAFWLL